jgi:hypothetical protein
MVTSLRQTDAAQTYTIGPCTLLVPIKGGPNQPNASYLP